MLHVPSIKVNLISVERQTELLGLIYTDLAYSKPCLEVVKIIL